MSRFHHAYNGIPTLRSGESFFADGGAPCLDHLGKDSYSGTLKLTIETKTPLITAWRDETGRLVVPSASGNSQGATSDADAIIPATSLKGVLSSAYEEVTQSRFRVFGDDHRQAQFRYTTDHPQRWQKNKLPPWKTGFLRVTPGDNGHQWSIHLQQCALLPDSIDAGVAFTPHGAERPILGGFQVVEQHDRNGKLKLDKKKNPVTKRQKIDHTPEEEQAVNELLKSLRINTPHLSKVSFFEAFEQKRPDGKKMIVSKINNTTLCTSKSPEHSESKPIKCEGYVVRLTTVLDTGELKPEDRLMATKYNEYIFYTDKGTPKPKPIQLDASSPFVATILEAARIASSQSYTDKRARHTLINRAIHYIERNGKKEELNKNLTPENVYNFLLAEAGTEPGVPVFVRRHKNGEWELSFSQLGRSATPGSLSPSRLAKKGSINPAQSIAETSAADRLWGFAAQDPGETVSSAFKGRVYLTNAHLLPQNGTEYLQHSSSGEGWIPPILAEPKPWTAQPYLRHADGSGVFEIERSECFTEQHSLIRKTYPTHRFLLARGGADVLGSKQPSSSLSNSHVLVGSFVKSGASFESTLRFEGLSSKELSVLLWLLDPEKIVPLSQRAEGEYGFFHLGLGKPLGLGAVCIRGEVLSLATSRSLASNYRDLNGVLTHDGTARSDEEQKSLAAELASVTEALPSAISKQTSLAVSAFVRSTYGWKSDEGAQSDPISYSPSTFRPKKQGLSPIISYFTEYEKSRIKDEEFKFRMLTLKEDIEDSVPQSLCTPKAGSPPSQGSVPTATPYASLTQAPRRKTPKPGPGMFRPHAR